MQFNWQEVKRLLVVFVGVNTEITSLQPALQRIRETLAHTEITLLTSIWDTRPLLAWVRETPPFGFDSLLMPGKESTATVSPCNDGALSDDFVNHTISYTTAWQDAAKEKELVEKLRQLQFDAAIIFTDKVESPYPLAYLSYLAGIPVRVGQSREFGGSVLSHWIKPPLDDLPNINPHLYLLDAAGFPIAQPLVPITKP